MRSSPIQYNSSPMIWAKYLGLAWMKGLPTGRAPCTAQRAADDVGEGPGLGVDERHRGRETAVDVGLLRPYPAEVLQTRQPYVLDYKVELGVHRRDPVHVGHVEGVLIQGPDRRSLVDVDVLYVVLDALVEVLEGPLVVQLPASGVAVPLGSVELHALEAVLLDLMLEGL